jgi:hypothetical protein
VIRWLCLTTLTGALAMSASGAHASGAAVTCGTAPGMRHIERVAGYRTQADAERAVRARCRSAALTFYARAAPVQAAIPEQTQERAHERACRRYPNLC